MLPLGPQSMLQGSYSTVGFLGANRQTTGHLEEDSAQVQKGPNLVDEPHGQLLGAGTVPHLPSLPDVPHQH